MQIMHRKRIYSPGNSASPFYMPYCWRCSTSCPESMPFYIMHRVFLKWPDLAIRASFLQPVYIGCANLLFTFLGMSIIDKGRKKNLVDHRGHRHGCFSCTNRICISSTGSEAQSVCDRLPRGLHRFFCDVAGRGDLGISFQKYFRIPFALREVRWVVSHTGSWPPLLPGPSHYCERKCQRRLLFLYFFQP